MAPIEDHVYMRSCAELASCLSISLSSARRRVELVAAKEGVRDLNSRKAIAEELLLKVRSNSEHGGNTAGANLDQLLEALAEDENFMVED